MRFPPLTLICLASWMVACAFGLGWIAAPAQAAKLLLKSGGSIEGTVEQVNTEAGIAYRVTTPTGSTMLLQKSQVARIVTPSTDDEAYAARATAAADRVEAQFALAKWCREHKLSDEAQRHASRVVELDPTHAEARKMLNFRQVDGEWKTRDQAMADRGMVWFEGKYRTRQEMAINERDKILKERQTYWSVETKKWRRWLTDRRPERVQEAMANFKKVSDPLAGPAVAELLKKERNSKLRRYLAKVAAQISHQATVDALVTLSLSDPDPELRFQCLESLIQSRRPGLVTPYVKGLHNNDNRVVNRAAAALGQLGNKSAMGPLIGALITTHKKVVGNSSGGDTYSMDAASGGFSFGGGGPKIKENQRINPQVLTALVHLSGGENYGYNQALWHKWLATQAQLARVDLRRDE